MPIETNKSYERYEDMSPDGRLGIIAQPDGDIIITIIQSAKEELSMFPSVEFCAIYGGGGQSPAVLEALHALMEAIESDNRNHPQQRV